MKNRKTKMKFLSVILTLVMLVSLVQPVAAVGGIQDKTVTETVTQEKTKTVTPEEEKTESVAPEEEKTESVAPEEEKTETVAPEEEKTETVTPEEEKTVAVTPEEEKTEAVTPEEEKTEAVTPQEEKTEAVTPQEEKTEAVTPEEEKTEAVTPEEEKTEAVTPKEEKTEAVTQKEKQKKTTQKEQVKTNSVLLDAEDEITWTDKGDFPFITKVSITNEDGTSIGDSSFDRNQKINLDFEFAIPNDASVAAGDKYTISIPEGFELIGNLSEKQLDETSGINVTWELTDNIITIRFYQSLENVSNVSGYMSIGCWFDKDSQLGQDGEDITFVIDGKTYTVDVYYDEITDATSADVTKSGSYNTGTKEITWTITVTPDSKNATLKNVTVKDSFDTSVLKYVAGSFAVSGSAVSDDDVRFNANGFEYTFPSETSPGAKTITYKTSVADSYFLSKATTVENNVSTYMPNGDKASEARAEVAVEKLPMQKTRTGYNAITKTLSWKIVANRNKLSLTNATIVDKFPEGSSIDTSTIKVNGQSTTNYQIDNSNNTLTISLGDINSEVTVTYDMVITDFSKFTQSGNSYQIENYARLNSGTSLIEEVTGKTSIGIGTGKVPIQKSGSVKIDKTYGQYIEWWTVINDYNSTDYKEITDPIVFKDKLPEGITPMPGSMTITCYFPDGTKATNSVNVADVYNSATREISYTITPGMEFGGVKSTSACWYGIWFATSIDSVQEGEFTNTASVTVGSQTNSDDATVSISYKKEDMVAKSGSYDYEKNTYDWTITVNKGNQAVLNPVIKDTLPEEHEPAYDYIYVDEQKVMLDGTEVNGITATYDVASNVITVSRKGYLMSASKIYISTKYVGEEQGNATNSVTLSADNLKSSFTVDATVQYKPLPILQKRTDYTQGDTITWEVVMNLDHDNLGQLSIVDQLSPGLSFIPSSVKMYLATISSNGNITATSTEVPISSGDIKYEDTTGLITIMLPKDLNTHQCYILKFDTTIQDKTLTSVTNSITFNGTDFQEGATSQNVILKTTSGSSGIVGEAGTVKIKKLETGTNKPLEGVAFQLLNANKNVITSAGWAVTNSEGIAEFADWLRFDTTYYIQEVRTLQGYVYDDTMYEVKVNSGDTSKVVEVTVYNVPIIEIEGTKTWVDGDNQDGIRPESITVNLLANGEIVQTANVTAESEWKYSFTDLPKYAEGKEIVYTISEEAVEGYEVTVEGYNLTNTHIPETVSVEGTKTWVDGDNQDGIRPESITVNLLANGEIVQTANVTAESEWKYSFTDLPKYAEGKEIVYTISEEAVEGYEVKVDGYNLINTHIPETVSVEGTKTWNDGNNQDGIRPESITVNLLADGKKVQTANVTAESGWKYSFTDLPKYAAGKEIVYTISEEAVEGYEVTVDGYNLTNTHVPAKEEDKNITPDPNNTGDNGKTNKKEGKTSENKSSTATPSKSTNSSNARFVRTGDATNVTVYLVSGLASLICIIVIFRIRKKALNK